MVIRRSVACRCVRTTLSIFRLNQTFFVETSLALKREFFLVRFGKQAPEQSVEICNVTRPEESKDKSLKSKSCWSCCSMGAIVYCQFWIQGHRINQFVGDKETTLNVQNETRVVEGQIVAVSLHQCTSSQHPEHLAVPDREEHHRTTSLFTWYCCKGVINRTRFEGVGSHQKSSNNWAEWYPKIIQYVKG